MRDVSREIVRDDSRQRTETLGKDSKMEETSRNRRYFGGFKKVSR